MRHQQIEAWVLRVVDSVVAGTYREDSTVELKRDWPDAKKAARQLAGHANSARGAPILWIVGLDEKIGVCARSNLDTAEWWSRIAAQFDEIPPQITDLIIQCGDSQTVVGLYFDTGTAPYVTKNSEGGGHIAREVPWREGTSVRSARRSDLIRLLIPLQSVPRLEIFDAELQVNLASNQITPSDADPNPVPTHGPDISWSLSATLYFTCPRNSYAVFPNRFLSCTVRAQASGVWLPNPDRTDLSATGWRGKSAAQIMRTVHDGVGQLIVDGPGPAFLHAQGQVPAMGGVTQAVDADNQFHVDLSLRGVDLPATVTATATLHPAASKHPGPPLPWRLGRWAMNA
jgi:hypothetical protein